MITTRLASFNGITFNVIATTVAGGHKQSTHEFNNNKASVQQHGARQKTYSLSAIFVGRDALAQCNKLISELDETGAGVLLHPYYGELSVALDTHSTNIDTKHSQVTTTLNFIQQDDVKLTSIDFHSTLLASIELTKAAIIIQTVTNINKLTNPIITIREFTNKIDININANNINQSLLKVLDDDAPTITSTNPTINTFNQQHIAIRVANDKIGKKYKSITHITNDATHIIATFNNPIITKTQIANEFYNLKADLSRYLIETNQNLPKLKIHQANVELPSNILQQQFGNSVDEFNTSIHPLFSDENTTYVS